MDDEALSLPGAMWHVSLTVNGDPMPAERLEAALGNLSSLHPFGLAARYANDLIEVRYWDEGHDCQSVVMAALQLWHEERKDLRLPDWPVVGIEVLDRVTFRRRWPQDGPHSHLLEPGVKPLTPR